MSNVLISLDNLKAYNNLLDGKKQDKLTAGDGIKIENGVITNTFNNEDNIPTVATSTKVGLVKPDNNALSVDENGVITINPEVVASQEDVDNLKDDIKDVDNWIPQLVEYEEDELYDIAWSLVEFNEKPEYSEEDLDSILDALNITPITPSVATESSAGIVKPDGSTITIDADGTIHGATTVTVSSIEDNVITVATDGGLYVPPGASVGVATTEKAGIIKPDGTTVTIDTDGVLSSIATSTEIAIGATEPTDEDVTLWIDTDAEYDLPFLTEENDPTVPSWAKTSSKPSYTASEIGALDEDSELALSEIDKFFEAIFKGE